MTGDGHQGGATGAEYECVGAGGRLQRAAAGGAQVATAALLGQEGQQALLLLGMYHRGVAVIAPSPGERTKASWKYGAKVKIVTTPCP